MIDDWTHFDDPRFALRFRYPAPTPEGHAVEVREGERENMIRVHISSPTSQELYFEVARLAGITPQEEYARHCDSLARQFEDVSVTVLRETQLAGRPACTYTLTLPDRVRTVVSVAHQSATYRLIYNPQSELNLRVLATVELLG